MTTFSWTDSIHAAFSSCLPCFSNSPIGLASPSNESLINQGLNPHDPTVNRVQRARADELQGLLAETDTLDTDTEAERMSLHSNPGLGTNRKKRTKKKKGKKITFFGYDLFGKPTTPPVHLPDEDHLSIDSHFRPRTRSQRSTASASTLDSDAAPLELDPATIAHISELELAQRAAQAIEAERLKQERRQARREKKRIAKALALAHGDGEFEGFQGSGGDLPPVYSYSKSETQSQDREHEYGPFVQAPYRAAPREGSDDAEADAPDFDGAFYTRKSSTGNGSSRSGSDSRSRTSASKSQPDAHRHEPSTTLSSPTSQPTHTQNTSSSSSDKVKSKSKSQSSATPSTQAQPTKHSLSKSKSKPKSRSTASGSSHTSTTQSTSLASPASASFPIANADTKSTLIPAIVEDDFDGTQGFRSHKHNHVPVPGPEFSGEEYDDGMPKPGFPSKGFSGGRGGFPSQGFPSSGLSTRVGVNGKTDVERDKKRTDSVHALGGAFLAMRGDAHVRVAEREEGL